MGTAIQPTEDRQGKLEYKKCAHCEGKGQVLVDVMVK